MKYALALAGGGTRGAFEVGVWRALCELGINISAICGTSIGAINGALFVSGADTEKLWHNIEIADIIDIDCKTNNLLSLEALTAAFKTRKGLDLSRLKNFIAAHISEQKIRRSDILYGLCTYNINTKKSMELFINNIPRGQLIEYIAASACFPGFKSEKINGEEFSDGGIQNNLPENMLIKQGFDTIISVSVKGMGFIQKVNRCGINIIEVNCTSPKVGIMEFDCKGISESISNGYFACMKAFGKHRGNFFSFDAQSYDEAAAVYGTELINNLENAAKTLDIDSSRLYSVTSLAERVLEEYRINPRLKQLAELINNNNNSLLHSTLDILGSTFHIANTIVYLSKHINNN